MSSDSDLDDINLLDDIKLLDCARLRANDFTSITFVRSKYTADWVRSADDLVVDLDHVPTHPDGTPMSICSWYLQYAFGPDTINLDSINLKTDGAELFLFMADNVEVNADDAEYKKVMSDEEDEEFVQIYVGETSIYRQDNDDDGNQHHLLNNFYMKVHGFDKTRVTFALFKRGCVDLEGYANEKKQPLLENLHQLEAKQKQLKMTVAPVPGRDMDVGSNLTSEVAEAYGRTAFTIDTLKERLKAIPDGKYPLYAPLGLQFVAPFDQAFEFQFDCTNDYSGKVTTQSVCLMFEAPGEPELDQKQFSQKRITTVKWRPTVLNPGRVKQDLTKQGFNDYWLAKRLSDDADQWELMKPRNDESVPNPTKNRVSIVLTPQGMEPDAKRRRT